MVEDIFRSITGTYKSGVFRKDTTFYFSIDNIKKTLVCGETSCAVHEGKLSENADCICKTSKDMFAKIWNDGYRPGVMDFMGGKIKSDQPQLLLQLLRAFGK